MKIYENKYYWVKDQQEITIAQARVDDLTQTLEFWIIGWDAPVGLLGVEVLSQVLEPDFDTS